VEKQLHPPRGKRGEGERASGNFVDPREKGSEGNGKKKEGGNHCPKKKKRKTCTSHWRMKERTGRG